MATASQDYLDKGYLIFDPGVDAATIDSAREQTEALYLDPALPADTSGRVLPYRDSRRLQDAWQRSPAVRHIATAPSILDRLQALYGRRPFPFQTLNFRVGSEQRPHSDTIHFNSDPAGFMCGVWVALEDIDMDNGPVVYYPGSHKRKELDMSDVLGPQGNGPGPLEYWMAKLAGKGIQPPPHRLEDYLAYEKVVEQQIHLHADQAAYATIRKGQAFLWAANLLHGGSTQTDRTRTRHSQVTHYFFEDCKYYTPLLSRGRVRTWRQPARIPAAV